MHHSSSYFLSKSLRAKLLAAFLSFGMPLMALAEEPSNQASDEGAEAIQAIAKLFETNDYAKALAEVAKYKPKFEKESFDYAYLCEMDALANINLKNFPAALPSLEAAYALADKHGYFQPNQRLELLSTIAQVYMQLATESKSIDQQTEYWDKSYSYATRLITKQQKKTQDAEFWAAQALYQKAASLASAKEKAAGTKPGTEQEFDVALMKGVEKHCENALALSIKPKEQGFLLLVAALQQRKDYQRSAEILELMVSLYPSNKNYWIQLANTYIIRSEARKDGDPEKDFDLIRSITAFERAQKLGILTAPKDYFTLVGLLINTKQTDAAIDLLEAGLADGRIEPEEKNYQLLAQSYQEIKKDQKAIDTFKKAIKLYPKLGALDLQVANLYYGMDKLEDALAYLKSGYAKGVDKPAGTQIFIAYLALELKRLEEARDAAQTALKLDPQNKDAARLLDGATQELKEREDYINKAKQKA